MTFGCKVPGVEYQKRPAAYAVVWGPAGTVAAIRTPAGSWLPGGGAHPEETPEETVTREVREELGREIRLLARIGQAVQYFFASDEDKHYEMEAVFFLGEFVGEPSSTGEYELRWLDSDHPDPAFFHACYQWAVQQGERAASNAEPDAAPKAGPL
jgi:8-oxo-dGTP diphosphatase